MPRPVDAIKPALPLRKRSSAELGQTAAAKGHRDQIVFSADGDSLVEAQAPGFRRDAVEAVPTAPRGRNTKRQVDRSVRYRRIVLKPSNPPVD
jgi:hypothetical protein